MTDKIEQRMHEAFDRVHMPAGLAERTLARSGATFSGLVRDVVDYVARTALQGLGAFLPEDGPPRNGDYLPGTETRTVRGPNPRSFSTRGGAR